MSNLRPNRQLASKIIEIVERILEVEIDGTPYYDIEDEITNLLNEDDNIVEEITV